MLLQRKRDSLISSRSGSCYAILFITISMISFVLWAGDIAVNKGSSAQLDLFFARMGDFLADFTNTSGYCAYRSPYDNTAYVGFMHKQYPPFSYLFFWLFSKFSWEMESYYQTDRFLSMYQEPFFLFMLFLVIMLCGIAVFELVRQHTRGSQLLRCGVAVSVVLSFPMLYTLERGNNTLVSAILTMFFLFAYDSSNRYRRELALFSLGAAAAMKLFPAIFGVLLLYDRRWKDALRAALYGLVLGILPFFLFDGGIVKNLPLWIRNSRISAQTHSPFGGCSFAAALAGFMPNAAAAEPTRTMLIGANYLVCVLLLVMAPLYRRRWETVLAVSIAVLSAPGHSGIYCLLYLLPFVVMFLNEEEHSVRSILVLAAVLLLMTDYLLFSLSLRISICLSVFVILLLIEGVRRILTLKAVGSR